MEELGDILKRRGPAPTPNTRDRGTGDRETGNWAEAADLADQAVEPSCERCGGRGWFTVDVPVSDPEFGRVVSCECQAERAEEEGNARLLRYSNLGNLTRFTFEALVAPTSGGPEAVAQFTATRERATAYAESPAGWLVLVGPHGSGKTHVAAAIANRCIARGHIALFMYVPDLMDHLRTSFGPNSEIGYSELFDRVRNTPLLILDDLGIEGSSTWAMEKLRQIINHRFNSELPTVVTTAEKLPALDPYLRAKLQTPQLSEVLTLLPALAAPELGTIPPAMRERMTLDAFDARGNDATAAQFATLKRALESARAFASYPDGWLTLSGPTGMGKTHLAVGIAGERITAGDDVYFAFVPDLLDHLRSTFDPANPSSYDEVFDRVRGAGLLVLDDLGTERGSHWAEEKLYQIVVHRYNHRLPTVITTPMNFKGKLGRVASRANDRAIGYVVEIDAKDYRGKDRGTRPRSTKRRGTTPGS